MVKINLATYNIHAYSKEINEKIKLDNLNKGTLLQESIEFNTFKEILISFFNEQSFTYDKKFLRIKRTDISNEKIFYGEFEFGSFGTKHTVVNAENDDETERIIHPDESVLTPYYFFIELFSNRKDALLILETKSNSGIKVILENWINDFLKKIRCTHFDIN